MISVSPVIFSIGPFEIRWYSVLILLGVIIGYKIITSETNRFHIKNEFVFNLLFWTLIVGILCARVYYVIFEWDFYSHNIAEIFKIWHGGLAIHGGLIGGIIVILGFSKKYNVDCRKLFDIICPGVIFAQAIGRWGNFFNGEAYGTAVEYDTLVKMKIIPQFVVDNMEINGVYHLPMFYFESILCIIGFIILLVIRRQKYVKKGQIFGTYLVWYGFIRLIIETFRTDSLMLFNIKIAQLVSVIMIIFGFYLIAVQARKPKLDELYNTFDEEIKY